MIYLASQSPRRRMLLKDDRIAFKTVRSSYKERDSAHLPPAQNAVQNALGKASHASVKGNGIVLGADTLIEFRNKIIGKPKNRADARRILKSFSGNTHLVLTGVALVRKSGNRVRTFYARSSVRFKKLSASLIEAYLDTGEYKDKAGGYGYQKKGGALVARVYGSKTNVIGLPMEKLKAELKKFL